MVNNFEKLRQIWHKGSEYTKSLAIMNISPTWAERLLGEGKQLPFPFSFKWLKWLYEIYSPSRCIVGEAYGYSSPYESSCSECCRIGNRFALYLASRSREKLQENKQRFVRHWNEEHSYLSMTKNADHKQFIL